MHSTHLLWPNLKNRRRIVLVRLSNLHIGYQMHIVCNLEDQKRYSEHFVAQETLECKEDMVQLWGSMLKMCFGTNWRVNSSQETDTGVFQEYEKNKSDRRESVQGFERCKPRNKPEGKRVKRLLLRSLNRMMRQKATHKTNQHVLQTGEVFEYSQRQSTKSSTSVCESVNELKITEFVEQ